MPYTITVKRKSTNGTLTFRSGTVNVNTMCWWAKLKVDAGSYTGYATRMANKTDSVTKEKRPGIWLGSNVPSDGGKRKTSGIFIHEGTGTAWSDGCIVIKRAEMMKIWNAIDPKEKPNVTVVISDA